MAIDLQISYVQKAHRLSLYNVADTVKEVYAGQLFQLNEESEWEYADGTKKAYPTLNNRYGGLGIGAQGERLEGRDDVSRAGKLSCLLSGYEIATDQFDDTVTYTTGAALYPAEGGKITLFDVANEGHNPAYIQGYVTVIPSEDHPMLRYAGQ